MSKLKILLFVIVSLLVVTGFIKSSKAELEINDTVVKPKFHVDSKENMQGIAYSNGHMYIGFDIGKDRGRIRQYTLTGKLVKTTAPLKTGHTAELDVRNKNGRLYVANGGGKNPLKIHEVDVSKNKITDTLHLDNLGNSGLLAVDNDRDRLIIHSAKNDKGTPLFSITDFNGKILKQFKIPYQGVPQGLEHHNGKIYFYTNSKITVIDEKGNILKTHKLKIKGESQGITVVDDKKPYIAVAYDEPHRIFELK
ncbi:YncE family protein [Peribacillus glennii]|uniref:Uncharacterized protein n=1 Tax=Peribacillus glennii TaxID=2303991 RepID=A0A372L7B4_9BACI|nr:hypothetical protein [Peribacillus glennii]RFU61123.1 hypothetical protein D0466_19260 [Peribacillus glennii]